MASKITGLNALIKDIKQYREDTVREIKGVIEDTATDIEIDATRAAPMFIKGRIDKVVSNGGLTVRVGVQGEDPLPVYWEFGTGESAKEILAPYPQEVKDLAKEYFLTGQGTLRGQPYLFPAVFKAEKPFADDIKAVLDKEKRI